MNDSKEKQYRDLIEEVKSHYAPYDPSFCQDNIKLFWYDGCQEINLWTYWQGRNNLDAKIMLVGQDWGSVWDGGTDCDACIENIAKANAGLPYRYLDGNNNPTDTNLIALFKQIGYDITVPQSDLFFTNFVLGYRSKGLTGNFNPDWIRDCREFFCRLANIIQPQVILCLGRSTFEGVLSSFGVQRKIKSYNQFIESEENPVAVTLHNGQTVFLFALAHCGALGTLNRNRGKGKLDDKLSVQYHDWERIPQYLKRGKSQSNT